MGVQTAVLATAEDLTELLDAASRRGARAIPAFIPADEPPALHEPAALFRTRPSETLYLLAAELAPVEVFTMPGRGPGSLERVNERTSPVVEVAPSYPDGNTLRAGRIYLCVGPSDSRYGPAKRLYDDLKSDLRGWRTAEPGRVKVGPGATALAESGAVKLATMSGDGVTLGEARPR